MSTAVQLSSTAPTTTVQSLPTARDTLNAFPSALQTSPPGGPGSTAPNSSPDGAAVSYYFVFIALVLCILAVALFFFWRRKKRRMTGRSQRSHIGWARAESAAMQQHLQLGRLRSAEESRVEGLNEQGEAPPPYVTKAPEEPGRPTEDDAAERQHQQHAAAPPPAIPLQTLTRETAGLPPYSPETPATSQSANHGSHTSRPMP